MGLSFTHCNAQWSYSGFHKFRMRLAVEAMNDAMPGDDPDPIEDLLHHSDCDGALTPEQCLTIAPRLRELVARWPAGDWERLTAEELATGMEMAAACNESLGFC